MKKTFVIVVFILFATVVFGNEFLFQEIIYTSEGVYKCRMWYEGRNKGEASSSDYATRTGFRSLAKISNGQWECVRKMLSRYQSTMGDTYTIFVEWKNIQGNEFSWRTVVVVCEFTSNTQYKYWTFIYN
jgi:uncharacterized protein HemY